MNLDINKEQLHAINRLSVTPFTQLNKIYAMKKITKKPLDAKNREVYYGDLCEIFYSMINKIKDYSNSSDETLENKVIISDKIPPIRLYRSLINCCQNIDCNYDLKIMAEHLKIKDEIAKAKEIPKHDDMFGREKYNKMFEIGLEMEYKIPYNFFLNDLDTILRYCNKVKERPNMDPLFHFVSEIKGSFARDKYFNYIYVITERINFLENLTIDSDNTGSCTEGPFGQYKETAILSRACTNVGKIYLQLYCNEIPLNYCGVSYVLKCKDNDIKNKIEQIVWMVDGVEVGPVIEFIKEKGIWKQTFYKGIYNAAKDAGISRIIFNMDVMNKRAKDFVKWLAFNENIDKYVDGKKVKKISKNKFEKKPPRYSLTLCDSSNGVIQSLKDFGGKYYAEAWFKEGDKDAFNCCDSTQKGRPLVKGIEVRVG